MPKLKRRQEERKLDNLEVINRDFYDFAPDDTYDTVFVSMSPILNQLASVDRLLALSRRYLMLGYWAGECAKIQFSTVATS